MNYEETCDYLFRQTPSFEKSGKTGFNEGLANTLILDEHTGHPHREFRTIHVAGTNGKGSVSHTLAAHLQQAGYRVGLYTSPHLVDFRERIRVNGEMIPEQYVIDFVEDFLKWNKSRPTSPEDSHGENAQITPSFFELTTAMAFRYFADRKVDIAVVEVGLGGRLDCTNIITPLLSIITNISYDHTDMLGDTLAKIAREKAGIIKPHVPVIIGEYNAETRPVFEHVAVEAHAPVVFAQDNLIVSSATPAAGGIHYTLADGIEFDGELGGIYQVRNTNTVLHALRVLQRLGVIGNIDYSAFRLVTKTTGLLGRWQKLREHPTVICDTGHNPGGWDYLSRQLQNVRCRQMHIVFGMVSDKDVESVMHMLPRMARYYFTKASTKRAIPEVRLLELGSSIGLCGSAYPTVSEAFRAALDNASVDDFVFVGGSTYVVSDMLKSAV